MLSPDIKEMDGIIKDVKGNILNLMQLSSGMQCVDKNCERILASVKMLELNISDVREFLD